MVSVVSASHSKRIHALPTQADGVPREELVIALPPRVSLPKAPQRRGPHLAMWIQEGGLELGVGGQPIAGLKPRLSFGETDDTPHALVPLGGPAKGRDSAGAFELHRFRLVPELDSLRARTARPTKATLNLKRYLANDVVVGTLDYRGPPLAAEGGLRFTMRFDDLAE